MVVLVAALPAEGRALRALANFKRLPVEFPGAGLYADMEERIFLLQIGVGKIKAACAVYAFLQQLPHAAVATLLNVGVCGHSDAQIGSIYRAQKVTDLLQGDNLQPADLLRRRDMKVFVEQQIKDHP